MVAQTPIEQGEGHGEPPSLPEPVALCFAHLTSLVARRGLVVVPDRCALLRHPTFTEAALAESPRATLSFAARPRGDGGDGGVTGGGEGGVGVGQVERQAGTAPEPAASVCGCGAGRRGRGFHVMATPSGRWVEVLTGLGATGVHVVLAWRPDGAAAPPGHPLIPMLTVSLGGAAASADIVLPLDGEPASWLVAILTRVSELASGAYTPLVMREAELNVDFQIPRGGAVSL